MYESPRQYLSSCPMHFHVAHVQWIHTCLVEDLLVKDLLGLVMRVCNGDGICGMIRRSCQDDSEDIIMISLSILEPLQNDCANTIPSAVAICIIIECLTCPSLGQ